ncbi:MAG TPA: phosphomannomutase/phosphoglucomutase [Longimicrobiales bacterium]|nr:phosphomannomutase/phosphoglucomutase [Longimicrobiales bacterium]
MALNEHIFREYDIRGVVDRDLTGDMPTFIGRAFASELGESRGGAGGLTVVVGHDNRPSSPALARQVIDGLRAAGVDAIFVGTVPTPVLYWAANRFGTDGGIQITGSHNPPEYNGFKMLVGDRSFYGEAIQRLKERIRRQEWTTGSGSEEEREVLRDYIADVAGRFELARPVKVVADCGNGTGSLVAVDLLEALGAEVVPLYCDSDGTFPNHHPDPTVDEYIVDLIARVRSEGAEVGIGFDGDADRIGAVDETGRIIRGDILLLLFALDLIERDGEGQKLIFDVKCSQALPEVLEAHGGEPIMWKTGHSLIKEKMKETGAPLGGELSGHICFADRYYGFDDALYAACRLVDLVARSDRPLSARTAEFPRYVSTPEIRVEVPEERKFEIVERAVASFSEDHEVIAVDGARILFEGGWGLLRASNTQPVLVLRYEARTEDQLEAIRSTMEGWLRTQGVTT